MLPGPDLESANKKMILNKQKTLEFLFWLKLQKLPLGEILREESAIMGWAAGWVSVLVFFGLLRIHKIWLLTHINYRFSTAE